MRYPESAAERLSSVGEACRGDVSHAAAPASRRGHATALAARASIPNRRNRDVVPRFSEGTSTSCPKSVPAPSPDRSATAPAREGRVEPGKMGASALGTPFILVETRNGAPVSPTRFPTRGGLGYRGSSLRSGGYCLSRERTMTRPPSRRPSSNKAPGHCEAAASTQRVGAASTPAGRQRHAAATTQYGTAGHSLAVEGAAGSRAAGSRAASGVPHLRGAVTSGRRFGHEQW
jgi:hypothetical protein